VLSLDPHWFSTMFGMLFMAGQALSSMAFLIALMVLLSHRRPMSEILTPRHLHDLGKLLLALVMVWAYFSFSQFLIVWAGNLPDEIPWYLDRPARRLAVRGPGAGGRPFRPALRPAAFPRPQAQFQGAGRHCDFVLFMRMVDLYWLVAPNFRHGAFGLSWMDLAAPVGMGGIWLAYFLIQLSERPLMPPGDPQFIEALEHGREYQHTPQPVTKKPT